MRTPEAGPTSLHLTACPLDCPDHCSLTATVRGGRLVTLDGDRRNPVTAGFICSKVRRFADHAYGDDRLRQPAVRVGPKGAGRFEPIGWDEALDRIVAELRRTQRSFGEPSILPVSYGGSNGPLTEGIVDRRLFRRLGASNLARTVCAAPSGRAQTGLYGGMPGVSLADYEHSRLIVVWGMNPSASGIHLVPIIKRARERGAKLVVIDPRAVPLATKADMHLALRPGTDVVLALAVVRWLFAHDRADEAFLAQSTRGSEALRERAQPWTTARAAEVCGLETDALEAFARLYADADPAVIRCGWGIERNRNGGSGVAAVIALPAVAGKFGVRGGGFTMSNSRLLRLPAADLVAEPEPQTRTVNMNRLGRALEELDDPPIKFLFVYDCNPLATLPDQLRVRRGLAREDLFTVVFDQVMTDTARWADLVLPATTFLEHDELRAGYGALVVQRSAPVIDRVGEARSNYEVFGELLRRLDLNAPGDVSDPESLGRALLRDGKEWSTAVEANGVFVLDPGPVLFVDTFPRTADRKVDLCPATLDQEAGPPGLYAYRSLPASDYPLTLISPATRRTISSTFGQLVREPPTLCMHPDDASARKLATGDPIRVWNDLGEVHASTRVTETVRPGVVELPKGMWCRNSPNTNTANALAPDDLTDLGGGATFNDARVEVEARAPAHSV